MTTRKAIKLYGTEDCHKTKYYKALLKSLELPFEFLDVKKNSIHAEALRDLYENRKLNFPTITIGHKKLRNPTKNELIRWINKLIPERLNIYHDKENKQYVLAINDEKAKIEYRIENNKMLLLHSEVPYSLRGRGIGKILVEKTFKLLNQEGYKAKAICNFIQTIAIRSKKWQHIIET